MSAAHQYTNFSFGDPVDLDLQQILLPKFRKKGWLGVLITACEDKLLDEAPEGWTRADLIDNTTLRVEVWYRFLDGKEDDLLEWSWNADVGEDALATLHFFSGVDPTIPWYFQTKFIGNDDELVIPRTLSFVDASLSLYVWAQLSPTALFDTFPEKVQVLIQKQAKTVIAVGIETLELPFNYGTRNAFSDEIAAFATFQISLVPEQANYALVGEDARDTYKSIVMRDLMDKKWTKKRESTLAKILAPIGEADNALGGLFGAQNFLNPDPTEQYLDIDLRSKTEVTAVEVNNVSINKPDGVLKDDMLIAVLGKRATAGSGFTPPAGWTLIRTLSNNNRVLSAYRKIAGDAEPGSYNWSWGEASNVDVAIAMMAYTGVDLAAPVIDAAMTPGTDLISLGTTLTPMRPKSRLISSFALGWITTTSDPPWINPFMTLLSDARVEGGVAGAGLNFLVSDQVWTPEGRATGSRAAYLDTGNEGGTNIGHLMALQPRLVG